MIALLAGAALLAMFYGSAGVLAGVLYRSLARTPGPQRR